MLIATSALDVRDSLVAKEEFDAYYNHLKENNEKHPWKFETVQGIFKQSDLKTDDTSYDPLSDHFGLALESWDHLANKIKELNESSDDNTKYKLCFFARHGQGYHNLVYQTIGVEPWEDHWSHLESGKPPGVDEHMVWGPDPYLTKLGEQQAKYMNSLVKQELELGLPMPEKLFVSPFTRSAQTLCLTMDGICMSKNETPGWTAGLDTSFGTLKEPLTTVTSESKPAIKLPVVVTETLRETIGSHTCDKRRQLSQYFNHFSSWGFEPHAHDSKLNSSYLTEEDSLYKQDWREPIYQQAIRANQFLQVVFDGDENIVWSSSHSGMIRGLLMASGMRNWGVGTAGMVPVLVKAVREG
ncbi:putative phosphomutase [Martiniozyma asiatica (nom. inval.)]|nr:putative phosphomutase [Martiniozyma asiatica]